MLSCFHWLPQRSLDKPKGINRQDHSLISQNGHLKIPYAINRTIYTPVVKLDQDI